MKTPIDIKDTANSPLQLGDIVVTNNASDLIKLRNINALSFLARHAMGDDGNLCDEDREKNAIARIRGGRVYSFYDLPSNEKLWIITEPDRSVTTILLPEDY